MKKLISILLTLGILIIFIPACTNENNPEPPFTGEAGTIKTTITFTQTKGGTRAAGSKAIPNTSWSNIKNMQLLLYNSSGTIMATKNIVPGDATGTLTREYIWNNVPAGSGYTLAIIANAATSTDNVDKVIGTTPVSQWTEANTYGKDIATFLLKHKPMSPPSGSTLTADWYEIPAEVFSAYAAPVNITDGATVDVGPMQLKRDVSMMRVRVNTTPANSTVNFAHTDAYLRIQRLPEKMNLSSGNGGGVLAAGNVVTLGKITAGTGANTFKTADPSSSDYTPTQIIDGDFKLWNDVIIFPNTRRDTYTSPEPIPANTERYGIVIAAKPPVGHIYANGDIATANDMVYWRGLVDDGFFNNMIREVNVTLVTGGEKDEPPTLDYGNVKIELSTPMEWDGNILDTPINL